ncbi:MAG: hypothetical protein QF662_01860, partial [Phycisphaerae bacterium]|nr:hypothetical protein [Phycisphaerae bacterium]
MAEWAKPNWRRWVFIAAPILVLLVAGAFYLFYPRTEYFHTDGEKTWRVDRSAAPRVIRWTALERLAGEINADPQTYEPVLSPDGLHLYFTRGRAGADANIFVADRQGNQWVNVRSVEAVNSKYDEIGASFTPDGKRMYFYSNRPGGQGGYDLWSSDREGDGWAKPVNLGDNANSPANEYDPSVSPDGQYLLFSSNRVVGTAGKAWGATLRATKDTKDYDIYTLDLAAEEPGEPVPLTALNTEADEGQPMVSPQGDFVYFASNRAGGHGGYDIWRTRVHDQPLKSLGTAENLGPEVNTTGNDLDPALSIGGFGMYLASNREGEGESYAIYHTTSREVFRITRTWRPDVGRVAGKLGWPLVGMFLTLAGVALLLLAFLKYRRKPGLLATCLGVSIVLHLLALFAFNLVTVQERIEELSKGPKKYEVTVSIPSLEESKVSEEVRKKILEVVVEDMKRLDAEKAAEMEAAEAEMVRAQPDMPQAELDAPTREEIELQQVSKPEQKVDQKLETLPEKAPEVTRMDVARMEQVPVKREIEKPVEAEARKLENVPAEKPIETPLPEPKLAEVALKTPDRAPSKEEIEKLADRAIELKVEEKLQKTAEKTPEVTRGDVAKMEEVAVKREVVKAAEAVVEARKIESARDAKRLEMEQAERKEREVAVETPVRAPSKQEIEQLDARAVEQKVEAKLQETVEKAPEVTRVEVAKMAEVPVSRDVVKVAETAVEAKQIQNVSAAKPLEMAQVATKSLDVAAETPVRAPSRQEIEKLADRAVEQKVEAKLEATVAKTPEAVRLDVAKMAEVPVRREVVKVAEAAVEARRIETVQAAKPVEAPQSMGRKPQQIAVKTPVRAPSKQQIEGLAERPIEQTVQENLQVTARTKTEAVDRLRLRTEKIPVTTKTVKTEGVQVPDAKATFRYSKSVGTTAPAPAPRMLEPEIANVPAKSTSASLAEGKTEAVSRKPVVDATVKGGIAKSAVALAEPLQVKDTMATVASVRRVEKSSATVPTARENVNAGRSERSFAPAEGALGKRPVEMAMDVEVVPVSTLVGARTEQAKFPEATSATRTERLTSGTGAESMSQPVVDVTESMLVVQTTRKRVATRPQERFGRGELATLKAAGAVTQDVAFTQRPAENAVPGV